MTPVCIDLGHPTDNPTVLCSQDWYLPKGNPPWNFGSINKLPRVTGPWHVDVKQAGRYRLTLRQFPKEADKFVRAATVPGVKSLLLDVEHSEFYWQGDTAEVKDFMQKIRAEVHSDTHIGLIIDPRRNRPFNFWIDPWIPFIDSLHPMEYPIMFGRFQSIEKHMEEVDLTVELQKVLTPLEPPA